MIELSVIIVLYNEFELVKKSLFSVYEQSVKSIEVILIDNSSDKQGHKAIIKKYPVIQYIQSKHDLGFAGAVNVGFKNAKGKYILVLTPDMYLLPNTVKKTLDYMNTHPAVGLVANRVYTSPGRQEPSVARDYPSLMSLVFYYNMPVYKLVRHFNNAYNPNYFSMSDHKKILYAKCVGGQSMTIRKKALDDVGFFDPRFFLYFEDVDLCRRLVQKDWQVVYLPVGGVVQNGKSGWKKTQITQALNPYMKSIYSFFIKYNGKTYASVAWIIVVFSALASIPYLSMAIILRRMSNKQSQAEELLPLWLNVIKWHFTGGISTILKYK